MTEYLKKKKALSQTHRPKHTEVKNIQGAHIGMKVTFETKVTSSALLNIYQTDYL